MKTRFFTKTQEYEGAPKLSDFKIVEEDIDENIEDGGALIIGTLYHRSFWLRFLCIQNKQKNRGYYL